MFSQELKFSILLLEDDTKDSHFMSVQYEPTGITIYFQFISVINPLNAELNPICHLLALLGAHNILHVSRITVNLYIRGLEL